MEKKEAIREWCVERAMGILQARPAGVGYTADEVIGVALKLEDYLNADSAKSRLIYNKYAK